MNLIDHYNSRSSNAQEERPPPTETQWLRQLCPKKEEVGLPNFLIYMRSQLEREYPHACVSIFAEEWEENGRLSRRLVISLLHNGVRWGRFQTYNQVVIDEAGQSVLIKGALVSNNQLLKIGGRQQVLMALRKASNLNPQLSPLRISINSQQGTLELTNCSYVDSKFALLNNSEKNVEYFTMRISFILTLIFEQMSTIFYVLQDESLAKLYCGNLALSIREGEARVQCLENTLFRTNSKQPQFNYNSKIADLDKHHVRFDNDVFNIMQVYGADAEQVEYCKPVQIQQLTNQHYPKQKMAELASEIDKYIGFRVYSQIHFYNERVVWRDLEEYSGNCRIQYADVRFAILPQDTQPPPPKPGKRESDESDTLYAVGEEAECPFLEAKITRKSMYSNSSKIEREKGLIRNLRGKRHPNLVTFFESQSPNDKEFLFTLFEENQSLELYAERCKTLSFFQKVFMLEQAAKGLLFLHRSSILHLDYKLANLIVGKKHLVKVCDFGQSCTFMQRHAHRFGSTFPYAPPQVYTKKEIGEEVDVYALGVTIYYCLFSEHIWGVIGDRTAFIKGLRQSKVIPVLLPEAFRNQPCSKLIRMLVHLCLRCVSGAPEGRPSLAWIVTFLEETRKCLQQMHYK